MSEGPEVEAARVARLAAAVPCDRPGGITPLDQATHSARASGSRPLVVYCAGVRWDGLRGTDQHMAVHLARHVDVLWVDPPLSVVEPLRTKTGILSPRRLEPVHHRVLRLTTPAPPFPERRGFRVITTAVMQASIRRAVRALGRPAAAMIVSCAGPRFSALPEALHVYYATDDFVAGAELMGVDRARLLRDEASQLAGAELVVGITSELTRRWTAAGRRTVVLPNGCDTTHFADSQSAPRPTDVDLAGPVAGVVGQLSARLDLGLLEAVAGAGVSLLLVGPLQTTFEPSRVRALLHRPNVRWVGAKPFDVLPSYLRAIDVGLTPYANSEFNRASFPLKTLEYLAAGLPVVSTPLPAVDTLASAFVRTGASPDEFVSAVRAALAEGSPPELVRARLDFAAQHSWAVRAQQLLAAMGLPDAGGSSPASSSADITQDAR
ncbi:glycosyltransferase [uncultured Cellulomonas sp.]|uniref:glycosyltransferase n=1 Tax=uncultured Cellulomonas sp. TaxID=189682 RepID=UPI0026324D46|nr:glycosyltransferase [uncultured Cellulomonas sp.]